MFIALTTERDRQGSLAPRMLALCPAAHYFHRESSSNRAPRPYLLLAIRVPAQQEESQPFLVHGTIVGDEVEAAFITFVQRRAEHFITITAPSVHATLAAGRALLRTRDRPATALRVAPASLRRAPVLP